MSTKTILYYLALTLLPVAGILLMLPQGRGLQPAPLPAAPLLGQPDASGELMPNLPVLLLQIAAILFTARLAGWLFRKIHQPQVIGEIVAGILLGPSLLGWLAPGIYEALFPLESLGFLSTLSHLGLILFMFLVGLELDLHQLRGLGRAALLISHVSIFFPFFLGVLLALQLFPRLASDGVRFDHFALFMGAALSITAFPVLARILGERNLLRSRIGALSIACAALNDIAGWFILAAVVLVVRADRGSGALWLTIAGSVAYMTVMLFVARRLFARFARAFQRRGALSQNASALLLLLVLLSSWVTELLGIHALFGAFLAGVVMPRQPDFVASLTARLEDIAVVLLLPLFFAFNGLRTSIGLLDSPILWLFCGLIILTAIAGKFGGSAVAARAVGLSWREAGAVGVLMNTRGLMELVLLNIGLDIGVISPALFAMLVLMALVTTFMTAPLLEWIYFVRPRPGAYPAPATSGDEPGAP